MKKFIVLTLRVLFLCTDWPKMADLTVDQIIRLWKKLTLLVKERKTRVTVREMIEYDQSLLPVGSGQFYFFQFDLLCFVSLKSLTHLSVSGQIIGPLFLFWLKISGSWKSRKYLTAGVVVPAVLEAMMTRE
jgi:hypothetical protein